MLHPYSGRVRCARRIVTKWRSPLKKLIPSKHVLCEHGPRCMQLWTGGPTQPRDEA